MSDILQEVLDKKIIAIVRGVPSRDMVRVAGALLDGGVSMMEITFDQTSEAGCAETLASLEAVKAEFAGAMRIGAGTVLTAEQAAQAHARGAEYIISPNVDAEVIARTKQLGMLSMPGALTPSEVAAAYKMGGDIIKLFPAGTWGTEYIKALRAPLAHIPMAAVGGVTPDTIPGFLAAGVCCFGIGSNLVNASRVAQGGLSDITVSARAFVDTIAASRG